MNHSIISGALFLLLAACSPMVYTHGVPNLAQVEAGLYRGGQPTAEGWAYIRDVLHIRTVVKLNYSEEGDDTQAVVVGLRLIDNPIVPMDVDDILRAPSTDELAYLASLLASPRLRPVYVHCTHGQDRLPPAHRLDQARRVEGDAAFQLPPRARGAHGAMGGNPVKRPTEAQLNTLYDHVGPRLRSFIKTKGDAQCLAEIREIVVFGMRELGIDCDLPIVTIDFAGTGTAMILWSEPPAVAIVANPATFFAGDSREGPFRCPVCNGNGQVSAGFYSQTSGMWSGSSTGFEGCRTCMQTGIVWR